MFRRTSAILLLVILALLTPHALATPQTFTGTKTDTMCGKKHMIPGKSDAECTRECMKSKGNWTHVLVVGNHVYGLKGGDTQVGTLAGQCVTVTGDVTANTIAVQTITPAK